MPIPPFRETYTLSDAFELTGRHLFGETWTANEYAYSEPRRSPAEIAKAREPLEAQLQVVEAEIAEVEKRTNRTLKERELAGLSKRRYELESGAQRLRTRLSLDHSLCDGVIDVYNHHARYLKAHEILLQAVRDGKLLVHDGRGRQLNPFVWSDQRFRYYCDLSIVVNSKTAGGPRWQAARIDRVSLQGWLKTVTPLVRTETEMSVAELLKVFLERRVAETPNDQRLKKETLLKEARANIDGVNKRMFELAWMNAVPPAWRKPGAPKKMRLAR